MKTIIDAGLLSDKPAGYTPFIKELLVSMVETGVNEEWILMINKGERPLITHPRLGVIEFTQSILYWQQTKKLLKWLNDNTCNCYIKLKGLDWHIHIASVKGFDQAGLQKAHQIVSFFDTEKKWTPVVPKTIEEWSWSEKQSVKAQYSNERDYFLYLGDIGEAHELVDLLKAFSGFKEWQQSNMKLLIAGTVTSYTKQLESLLQQYKYRQDVQIIRNPPFSEQEKLLRSCYALVYTATDEKNNWPLCLVQAVQHRVAVIASDMPLHRSICAAAIWIDNTQLVKESSAALQLLYKDEEKKNELANKQGAASIQHEYAAFVSNLRYAISNTKA